MMDIWKNRDWSPMLLKEIDKPFDSNDYLFEVKFDGIRAIIFANKDEVIIKSRNKQDITYLFPELQSIKNIVKDNIIFDGEIVAFENDKVSFSKIQKRLHLKNKDKINTLAHEEPITFVAFDILYENKDITSTTLENRKKILKKYKDTDVFVKAKSISTDGIKLFNSIKKLNLEGIVAKEKNGKYHINKRTDDFIKIKNIQRDEFIIGGFTEKKNGILSLAIGEMKDNLFYYVGKVSINNKTSIYEKIKNSKKVKITFVILMKISFI